MKLTPKGYYVLVEIPEVFKTSSNIIIPVEAEEGEIAAADCGYVRAIGPTAYSGMEGIKAETSTERAKMWGIKVGDKVEFKRYDGKKPSTPGYENYRLILDQHINCGVED